MDKTPRRRGRPPKNADEYLTNLAQTMKMLKRRRELTAEIEKLTAEGERELELFCLNCTQKNCEHGDCQPLRDKRKKLMQQISRLRAEIGTCVNTRK